MTMVQEHATCAAFYAVGAKCFEKDTDPSDRDHMQKATVQAMLRAFKYSKEIGIAEADTVSKYRIIFSEMANKKLKIVASSKLLSLITPIDVKSSLAIRKGEKMR